MRTLKEWNYQVSNCVLLDEYRHNLSAALGHLPGDEEGDLDDGDEGEEGDEGGEEDEENEREGICEKEEGEKKDKVKEVKKVEEEVKLLENGLTGTGSDLGQEHMRGFDRILDDSKNEANISY